MIGSVRHVCTQPREERRQSTFTKLWNCRPGEKGGRMKVNSSVQVPIARCFFMLVILRPSFRQCIDTAYCSSSLRCYIAYCVRNTPVAVFLTSCRKQDRGRRHQQRQPLCRSCHDSHCWPVYYSKCSLCRGSRTQHEDEHNIISSRHTRKKRSLSLRFGTHLCSVRALRRLND